jgi:hypothetical protein
VTLHAAKLSSLKEASKVMSGPQVPITTSFKQMTYFSQDKTPFFPSDFHLDFRSNKKSLLLSVCG